MSACRIYSKVLRRIPRTLKPGHVMRYVDTGIAVVMLSVVTACAAPIPSPIGVATRDYATVTSPQVVATAYTAILIGELVKVNGCLQVKSSLDDATYTLAWPSNIEVLIADKEVKVTIGIVRGHPETVILHFGDIVRISGGETEELGEQLYASVSEGCPEPYWIVGFEISRNQAITEP